MNPETKARMDAATVLMEQARIAMCSDGDYEEDDEVAAMRCDHARAHIRSADYAMSKGQWLSAIAHATATIQYMEGEL